jgi:hypothetical protein
MSQRNQAVELLDKLRDEHGVDDKAIAEYLIYNYMSGDDALDALKSYATDLDISVDEEEADEEEAEEVEAEEVEEETPTPNAYLELKRKHEKEVKDFPMVFAFSDSQFKEAMEKLELTESDTDKIYSIGGGGFIRKTDSQALKEMTERHSKEMQDAIDSDENGQGFIFDMFDYELANHEYCITWEVEPTLDALGLTYEEVMANEKLKHGLELAKKANSNAN